MSFVSALYAAAGADLGADAAPTRRRRKLGVVVAVVAFTGLVLELLVARLFPFMLGNISAFIAVPVAMLGLSFGALALHWRADGPGARAIPALLVALLVAVTGGLFVVFWLFNGVFGLTPHMLQNPHTDAVKIVGLTAAVLPAFALVGVLLSAAFSAGSEVVGRLYALDLAGSAAACLLAPLLMHFFGLSVTVVLAVTGLCGAIVYLLEAWRRPLTAGLGAGCALLLGLAATGHVFVARPDPQVLAGHRAEGRIITEVDHAWNEVSRVGVLKMSDPRGEKLDRWLIVHDDGISNVWPRSYKPARVEHPPPAKRVFFYAPFELDTKPKSALVMFAGCGRDMVHLYEYAAGDLDVVGVELNPLVPKLALRRPSWNLKAFYDLPDISFEVDEGRAFLERDDRKYDLIFVATHGPLAVARSGHSRKFLDTVEAMEAYLDHLAPGGTIVFNMQDLGHKLEIFKRLLAEEDGPAFEDSVALFGQIGRRRKFERMMIRPSGFSPGEAERLRTRWDHTPGATWAAYVPHLEDDDPALAALVRRPPVAERRVPTDDQPFERRLNWQEFELSPPAAKMKRDEYALSWVKVFTLLLFTGTSLVLLAAFWLRRRGGTRMPVGLVGYFAGTGAAYMLAQIGLMARLELFFGRPLYSIAVVLAAFLLFNARGSAWVDARRQAARPATIPALALAAAVAVPLTFLLVEHGLGALLWLPIPLKVPVALAALAPLGFVLGAFYPTGVSVAVDADRAALVPMTFGLATLSSVVGSTWAMVAVIEVGFRAVVFSAVPIYLLLAVVAAVASRKAARPA